MAENIGLPAGFQLEQQPTSLPQGFELESKKQKAQANIERLKREQEVSEFGVKNIVRDVSEFTPFIGGYMDNLEAFVKARLRGTDTKTELAKVRENQRAYGRLVKEQGFGTARALGKISGGVGAGLLVPLGGKTKLGKVAHAVAEGAIEGAGFGDERALEGGLIGGAIGGIVQGALGALPSRTVNEVAEASGSARKIAGDDKATRIAIKGINSGQRVAKNIGEVADEALAGNNVAVSKTVQEGFGDDLIDVGKTTREAKEEFGNFMRKFGKEDIKLKPSTIDEIKLKRLRKKPKTIVSKPIGFTTTKIGEEIIEELPEKAPLGFQTRAETPFEIGDFPASRRKGTVFRKGRVGSLTPSEQSILKPNLSKNEKFNFLIDELGLKTNKGRQVVKKALDDSFEEVEGRALSLENLNNAKRKLDELIDFNIREGSTSSNIVINNAKNKLNDYIRESFPGFTEVQARRARAFQIQGAYEKGFEFSGTRKNISEIFDPTGTRKGFNNFTPNEKIAFRQGVKDNLIREITTKGERTNVARTLLAKKSLLNTIMGKGEASKLIGSLQKDDVIFRNLTSMSTKARNRLQGRGSLSNLLKRNITTRGAIAPIAGGAIGGFPGVVAGAGLNLAAEAGAGVLDARTANLLLRGAEPKNFRDLSIALFLARQGVEQIKEK